MGSAFFIILIIVIIYQVSLSQPKPREYIIKTNSWLFKKQVKLLEKYFPYFHGLQADDRKEFLIRLNTIMRCKQFIAKEGFYVSYQTRTLIAGSITQLTFGLKNYKLDKYNTINIYPDAYLNHRTNKLYKGETNTLGFITLSWKHFMDGYLNTSDRINVGLHEMAHALLNTIAFTNQHDPDLDTDLIALDKIPPEEREKLYAGDHPFFRGYAQTNIKEFFAVAIEGFFEGPEDFKNQFPVFYHLMCKLLNQDPANKQYRHYNSNN